MSNSENRNTEGRGSGAEGKSLAHFSQELTEETEVLRRELSVNSVCLCLNIFVISYEFLILVMFVLIGGSLNYTVTRNRLPLDDLLLPIQGDGNAIR